MMTLLSRLLNTYINLVVALELTISHLSRPLHKDWKKKKSILRVRRKENEKKRILKGILRIVYVIVGIIGLQL